MHRTIFEMDVASTFFFLNPLILIFIFQIKYFSINYTYIHVQTVDQKNYFAKFSTLPEMENARTKF